MSAGTLNNGGKGEGEGEHHSADKPQHEPAQATVHRLAVGDDARHAQQIQARRTATKGQARRYEPVRREQAE